MKTFWPAFRISRSVWWGGAAPEVSVYSKQVLSTWLQATECWSLTYLSFALGVSVEGSTEAKYETGTASKATSGKTALSGVAVQAVRLAKNTEK